MIESSTQRATRMLLTLALLLVAAPAMAARGLVLNAYDAEGLGLGGADIAITQSTTAVNSNPAGLAQLPSQGFDAFVYPYFANFRHSDSLGNYSKPSTPAGAVLAGSYAQRLQYAPSVVVGIGLFAQGGTGLGYKSLLTQFGTRDELSSNIGIFRLASGFAWQATDQLDLGFTLGLAYARGSQKLYPDTSDAAFQGLRFDGGQAMTPNVQFGLQYRLRPELTLAAVYISKTALPLTGGTVDQNLTSSGLGRVRYQSARIDGFALPQEVDLGLAWQINHRWLLTTEVNWLDYSQALVSTRLRATRPNNPAAPATIDISSPLNWHDQYVFAMGAAYALNEHSVLRGGFNIENSPIPNSTATPILNFGQKREVTIGYGHKFAGSWSFDAAFEFQPAVFQRYSNPSLALGDRATERYQDISGILAISRRW